jgi:hypothetical protein
VSISAFRRRAWTQWFASLLLAAWLVPIAAPHADDDPLCSPTGAATGSVGIKAHASATQPPHHCVICHSLRSSRTLSDAGAATTAVTSERHRTTEHPRGQCGPDLSQLPARAPPA